MLFWNPIWQILIEILFGSLVGSLKFVLDLKSQGMDQGEIFNVFFASWSLAYRLSDTVKILYRKSVPSLAPN